MQKHVFILLRERAQSADKKMVLVSNQSAERRPKGARLDGHRPSTSGVK